MKNHFPKLSLAGIALCLLLLLMPATALALPALPESDLSWKNISVNGRKAAVFCIFRDSQGLMWIGTNNGLYFYDGANTHPVGRQDMFGIQIFDIVEKDSALYIGSNNGLLTYSFASGEIEHYPRDTPKEIRALELIDNTLWIGGLNGIARLNLADNSLEEMTQGLPHRSVYSLLRDRRGILYAGTYNGIARWDSMAEAFRPIRHAANSAALFANCMIESPDSDYIYIGGEGALYRYCPVNEHWERINSTEGNNIKSLAYGDNGQILVGTDNGIFEIGKDSLRRHHHDSRKEMSVANNEIWCIYCDKEHNIWVGHERGFSIATSSRALRIIKLSDLSHSGEGNEIHSICRDSGGDLWLGGHQRADQDVAQCRH